MRCSVGKFRPKVATFLVFSYQVALATPATPLPTFEQPNAYAVVIGISQYREEVIPKVAYAVRDAEAVARVLESLGGIPRANIKLLIDSKATFSDLRNHFGAIRTAKQDHRRESVHNSCQCGHFKRIRTHADRAEIFPADSSNHACLGTALPTPAWGPVG